MSVILGARARSGVPLSDRLPFTVDSARPPAVTRVSIESLSGRGGILECMVSDERDDEPVILELDDGNLRLIRRTAWIGWWVVLVISTMLALALVFAADRPPPTLSALSVIAMAGILRLVWWVTEGNRDLGSVQPSGSVVLDDAGVHLTHYPALAREALVPWEAVTGIVIDRSSAGRGFPYETDVKRRFLLDDAWSGVLPAHRRPPLLAAGPVRPNLLFILDPPLYMEWAHPHLGAMAFAGFRGPGAPALPWSTPRETPAVWMRVLNLNALKKSPEAISRIRPLTKKDGHRFRYEFGDLPGPNPYRRPTESQET